MSCPFSAAGRFEERRRDAEQNRAAERVIAKGKQDSRLPRKQDE